MLPSASHLALEDLGWASFQDLAMAYAEDLLAAPVTTYARTWDGGVDGEGGVLTAGPEAVTGRRLAIQAKHTARQSSLTEAGLEADLGKLSALVAEGFDTYLLVTNLSVTRITANAIRRRVLRAGFKACYVHGRNALVRRIRSSPRLRVLAPRLYGIGDLSEILDERRAEQTQALLEAARHDLDRFVVTEPYRTAVRALTTEGVVVLLGEPAAGKSTIAQALTMAARDAFGAKPFWLLRIGDLKQHWNPNDPARLFWVDDVFGATQADHFAGDTFNRMLPTIAAAVAQGNRFVFTSRTYIWRAIQPQLKVANIPAFANGIVEVKLEDLSDRDRALILANHVRLSDHDRDWKSTFKPLAPAVARHPQFTPEVARRLGMKVFTADLKLTPEGLDAYVANPSAYLETLIGGLSPSGQAALALLFMHGGELPMALPPGDSLGIVTEAFAVTGPQIRRELAALEGSLSRRAIEEEEPVWRFRHPTIGEAFATVASRTPALMDVYLRGAPLDRILEEVVCAGETLDGSIIQVGRTHYDLLIRRMKTEPLGRLSRIPRYFLIARATPEFRRRYFTEPLGLKHPVLDDGARLIGQTLALIATLLPEGLVDPDYLAFMRQRIADGLLKWGHPACMNRWAREILGPETFDRVLDAVVAELREGGWRYLDFWEPSRHGEDWDSPGDAYRPLAEFVEQLELFIDPEEAAEVSEIFNARMSRHIDKLKQAVRAELDRDDEESYLAELQASRSQRTATRALIARHAARSGRVPDPIADVFSDLDD